LSDAAPPNPLESSSNREAEIRGFVRQLLDRSPAAGYGEVIYQWGRREGVPVSAADEALLSAIFDEERARRPVDSSKGVWGGMGLALLLHLLQIPLGFLVALIACSGIGDKGYCELGGILPFMFIGVSQLLYLGPAALIARRTHHAAVAKGIVITAAIGFLLNAGCYGLLFGVSLLGT
jgi:hypothetical protein